MWKKLLTALCLTVMASSFMVSADTSSAVYTPNLLDKSFLYSAVANLSATPMSFDPSKGESTTINFDLSKNAGVYLYALDSNNLVVPIRGTELNTVSSVAGRLSFSWSGRKSDGTPLANGQYTIKVYAILNGSTIGTKTLSGVTITSSAPVNPVSPIISGLKATPSTFSTVDQLGAEISFSVNKGAYLKVEIKQGSNVVKTFSDYSGIKWYESTINHSVSWNGTNNSGAFVSNGTYTVVVTAVGETGATSTTASNVTVVDTGSSSNGIIESFRLNPALSWDPTDEELELKFELTQKASNLTITAKSGNKVVEILDDDYPDDAKYTETWDGTDDEGDYVTQGTWEITVRADGYKVTKTLQIQYEDPNITEAFVTKDTFDPDEGELINLVFKVDSQSVVTIEAYRGTNREVTLVKDEEVQKNKWYAVEWDGLDKNGDKVDYGKDWKFKITAENNVEDSVNDSKTVEFDVEVDDASDKDSNITADYIQPVVFDKDNEYSTVLSYTIDMQAEVYVAVYKGLSTSGKAEIELLDYMLQSAGSHNVEWNVTDDDGKRLKDGIYTYKIITKADGNHKETEIGRFVLGDSGNYVDPYPTPKPVPPVPPVPDPTYCGGFKDTYNLSDSELCQAIEWASSHGIFTGYGDGSFGVNKNINRAEVLKVTLNAFDSAVILPIDGSNQGFWDLDGRAWYMPYVRTAKFYGMMAGYPDGSAKLNNNINRVEFLKFVLEASRSFTGYSIPQYYYSYFADVSAGEHSQAWFLNYAGVAYDYMLFDYNYDYLSGKASLKPGALVTRGEVAKLLYRMNNYGMLNSYYPETPYMDMGYY